MNAMDAPKDRQITKPVSQGRCWGFKLAALALVAVCGLGGMGLARLLRAPQAPTDKEQPADGLPKAPVLFRDWPNKPELVFLLSAQMHGYMLPCGCSRPQVGGLERRYNFLEYLKGKGWPVVPLDVGDLAQKHGPVSLPNRQGLIKFRYTMEALKTMGYPAVSFGEYEAGLPLMEALSAWPLQGFPPPMLAANLDPQNAFKEFVPSWIEAKAPGGELSVGVAGIIAPTVSELAINDPQFKFVATQPAMDAALKEMTAKKVAFPVVLYQGSATRGMKGAKDPEATAFAKAYPQVPLILCLSEHDTPPAQPGEVKQADGRKTLVVTLGHKGKYAGVVGVWKTGKAADPYEFRYQLVELTEDWLTPNGKDAGHPIVRLMENYTAELKKDNYLERYPQSKHPMQVAVPDTVPTFVGSQACKACHKLAHKVWEKTPHHEAYQTLVNAKRPGNRQFDPECIVCHTVGFGYHTGFVTNVKTPKLKDVGCESCHGPASEHVKNKNNAVWYTLMNPWKAPANETPQDKAKRERRIDQFCQKCHDVDNDVTWTHGGFERKWPKIAHPTPADE